MKVKAFWWLAAALALVLGVALVLVWPDDPAPLPPAAGPRSTVAIYGGDGTFGSLGATAPSGQALDLVAVPGWATEPAHQITNSTVTTDGTVLIAGDDLDVTLAPAREVTIGAYDPATNTYTDIRLYRPGSGTASAEPSPPGSGAGVEAGGGSRPGVATVDPNIAPAVPDLEPVNDGRAAAFILSSAPRGRGSGAWPVLGVISRGAQGWRVAPSNQWTAAQLIASNPGVGELACLDGDCGGPVGLTTLPISRDLIVAQGRSDSATNGGLTAIRLIGPDERGRYTATVRGHYRYPTVLDPTTADPSDRLHLSPREIHADPTSRPGRERFALALDVWQGNPGDRPTVLQEFEYTAETGVIRPVSAPILPGDTSAAGELFSYQTHVYDGAGNLWAARGHGLLQSGPIGVYAKSEEGRRIGGSACPYDPKRPLGQYVTTTGQAVAWGQRCQPEYDIMPAQELLVATGLAVEPSTGTVAMVSFGGVVLPIRVEGGGSGLRFEVGNQVDLGYKLLARKADDFWFAGRPAGVDGDHRLWFSGVHGSPVMDADRWLNSVRLADLFHPAPVLLPDVPGDSATVQAEHTLTTATDLRPRPGHPVAVVPVAYVSPCTDWPGLLACGFDDEAANGMYLRDSTGSGHLHGSVEYHVTTPIGGTFRVAFRAVTFDVIKKARVKLSVDGREVAITAIDTGGAWATVDEPETIVLSPGAHMIRLEPVEPDGGGWALNWFTLQRG